MLLNSYFLLLASEKNFLSLPPQRELSSVGSEHRPYKAGVVGSSPTVPTNEEGAMITAPSSF